jgi:hypothetical protein
MDAHGVTSHGGFRDCGCGRSGGWLIYLPSGTYGLHRGSNVYWFGVLVASIGAGAILFALTFVSLLIGVVVNAMGVLIAGPLVDRLLARRRR